jgi:hypothetical protein
MTLIAVFKSEEKALEVAESAKEVAPGVPIRVLVPGDGEVEVSVVTDRSDWPKVSLMGFILGLLGAYIFDTMGASWRLGLIGLIVGAGAGVLLGLWLTGETLTRRNVELEETCRDLLKQGRSVIIADPRRRSSTHKLHQLFYRSGAQVSHHRVAATVAQSTRANV